MAEHVSRRAVLACIAGGIVMLPAVPVAAGAAAASTFGFTNARQHYVVDTAAGLVFGVRKSDGAMSWVTYRGRALSNRATPATFGSGFADGALVTARSTGDHVIVRACSTDANDVATYRYLVARKADPAIYLAVHTDGDQPLDGPCVLVVRHGAAPVAANPSFMHGLGLLGLTPSPSPSGAAGGQPGTAHTSPDDQRCGPPAT
ncbi:rhamnogalacturonan lyase B N-terminal domain-containing protein [Kutzneria sp. NPDC051319]|uniref:rhamnogalacturonan lyase B N-terminal domain-containing protein n=1 Tax=Kutzneria sp. NPDC051319 TaxID=3155047 RepID=UPI00344A5494